MTLEEKAEQFADNIGGLELTCSLLASKDKGHAYRLGRYEGYLAGVKEGLKMKVNITTISDAPLMEREQLERAKKIIEELHEIVANKVEYKSTILMWNTMARAEKLLKELQNDTI